MVRFLSNMEDTWTDKYGVTFSADKNRLIKAPKTIKNNYAIPIGVKSIMKEAFSGCSGLTSINIPDSVTSIGHAAFRWCKGLTSVIIPNSVTSIGDAAFINCKGLTSVVIPDSVTSIGKRAFCGCEGLTSVIIPDSVTSIGEEAFEGRLIRGETWVDEYGVVFSADKTILFEAPKGLKEYIIPDGTKAIGQYAFSDTSETLECVLLPESVKVIENHAFAPASGEWEKMTSIEIPDGVRTIGEEAFMNVKELKYKGKATGYPWGAKVDNSNYTIPSIGPYVYCGEMLNGLPHGQGGYYDSHGGTPLEEGTYRNGELVDGYGYDRNGSRYVKGGDTWNGYGSGLDSEGKPYTGRWYWGHTEESLMNYGMTLISLKQHVHLLGNQSRRWYFPIDISFVPPKVWLIQFIFVHLQPESANL